jgi:hypothetical protein
VFFFFWRLLGNIGQQMVLFVPGMGLPVDIVVIIAELEALPDAKPKLE